jgi:hypothetical protein
MKRQLFFLVLLFFVMTSTWAITITVGPGGSPAYNYSTIQAAINAAVPGTVIKVAPGLYLESNIVINKSVTIQGTGSNRDLIVIGPAAEDGNADNAFGNSAQNGFIIAAHAVTLRNLTLNGRGNSSLTAGKNNFRAGVVTLDQSQAGGGVWNNLHVDNVVVKYAYRRGISVFPRTVSGTVIENSTVEYVTYNQGMYLAGHSLVLNNNVKHCFQGIVLNPDATTPTGLFKINGNTVTEIGNFPGGYGVVIGGQPRAIQFDPVDPTFRTVEIKNNTINDNGSTGIVGTVGIYTRRANPASVIENNLITLHSGNSYSVVGGSQSIGLLLGWSYANGFKARLNQVTTSGYGLGIMIFGCGSAANPMILESNILTSTSSTRIDTADGTGIYIANQYLFYALNKNESFVKILNNNRITGFVRGIDVVKTANSAFPLTVTAHNNIISGNTLGFGASTLSTSIDATNNYWGNCSGPQHATNPTGIGNPVSNLVDFMPWWCDAGMAVAAPAPSPGMAIRNTTTGMEYPFNQLMLAFIHAANGQTLYIAPGMVDGNVNYIFPGKTLTVLGSGIPGQSVINGAFQIGDGSLIIKNGILFASSLASPAISSFGGSLKLRNCIFTAPTVAGQPCIEVLGGAVDAGSSDDFGQNQFLTSPSSAAINNLPFAEVYAIGNDWGSPTGPTIASNPFGSGGAITGPGQDFVYYGLFANAPVTTASSVFICAGETTVDIPITVDNFNNVGGLSLTFGFTPAQLTAPSVVYTNPAFSAWAPLEVTTDPVLLAAGTIKLSTYGDDPPAGVTLPDGTIIFTLRFNILPNQGTNSTAAVFFNESASSTACEYTAPASTYYVLNDKPTSSYYINGGVTLNQRHKISGVFTYYNAANTLLTGSDISVQIFQSSDLGHVAPLGTYTTNSAGYYEFADLCPADTYDIVATSTHTTEGSVNTTDAAQVNAWPTALYPIEKVRFHAGDVGTISEPGSLELNATDALRIQQHFVNGTAFDRPWTFWTTGQFISVNSTTESYPSVTLPVGVDVSANMYGLCTGDFNRSFNPLLKKTASKTLSLIYGRSLQVSNNQEFDLPIHIVHSSSVGAVSLILNFPSDLAEIKDVVMNSTNGRLDWALIGNQLRIGWNAPVAADLAAYDNLITLRLVTKETFLKGASIKLTLTADPLNELANDRYEVIEDAILSVDVAESSLNGIDDENGKNLIRAYNYPNPFANNTTLAYSLPFNGDVSIEIRNTFGVIVKKLTIGNQGFGDHSINLEASNLSAGVYTALIKLTSPSREVNGTIKLVISK